MGTQQGYTDDRSFQKVENSGDFPFQIADQKFIVFSMSHQDFAPKSTNPKNPAICIYGAFGTQEEALEYAREFVIPLQGSVSVLMNETHKWIAAVKSPNLLSDPKYIDNHTEKLLQRHQDLLHTNLKEFEENVKEQK